MEALNTKEEAAEALKQYTHKSAQMGALVVLRDRELLAAQTKVQEKHQPAIVQLSGELTEIEGKLKEWAEANREVFGESKSLEFHYGFLKFREGPRKLVLLSQWTWERVEKKLFGFPITSQWQEFIRRPPEIDKQKLLAETKDGGRLAEAKLRDIGLRVDREESFSIKTKPEVLAADFDLMP